MIKQEQQKPSKLNDIDRHILSTYSNMSYETGAIITAKATKTEIIHKNIQNKV